MSQRLSNPFEVVWKSFSLVFFAVSTFYDRCKFGYLLLLTNELGNKKKSLFKNSKFILQLSVESKPKFIQELGQSPVNYGTFWVKTHFFENKYHKEYLSSE